MEDNQLTPLRFGIMVDDLTMEAWKVETVRKLVEGGMQLAYIICNAEPTPKKGFFKKLTTLPVRRAFFQLWNHYQFKPAAKRMIPLSRLGIDLESIPILDCIPRHEKTSTFISDNDIEIIKNQHLDFILRFGFDIIRGDILEAAKHGIWSFHHDDEMTYRGGPPGFWEWMHDNPRNGIILQRLTSSLDKGYILCKRFYPTILHSYKAHLDQLLMESTDMPLQVCRQIQHTGELQATLSESKAKLYRPPVNLRMLGYWIKCLTRRCRFHLHDLFHQEDWNVGYVEVPLSQFLDAPEDYLEDIQWLRKKRRSVYNADPFVITTEKDTYLFFECYNYRQGKGHIEVVCKSNRFRKPKVVLEEPFHLSYPFVFEHDGTVYCLPECHQAERLYLYRFNEENLQLERDAELIDHIQAIDPTLLFSDGRWNLFFTQKDQPSVKLYRYVADDLRGPYRPHWNNPVKVDCADARMAGAFFKWNGQRVRPAQECIRYYGTAVCLNRVDALDNDQYKETPIERIQPITQSKFKKGLHTINGNDQVTVLDGKRWLFTFVGMYHQIRQKANRRKEHV